jgi:hypothetical protein
VAQVLRELESTARAQQAAASERAQQAALQDIAEKREAADRVAAEIMEEEEREQAAQTKVRLAPPSLHIGLHSVQLGGERCGGYCRSGQSAVPAHAALKSRRKGTQQAR